MTDQVIESSTPSLTVEFFNPDGDPLAPSGVTYRIDCMTTGEVVRAPTALSPSSSVQIEIASEDTAIQRINNPKEIRRVLVEATYGASGKVVATFDFEVLNLRQYVP